MMSEVEGLGNVSQERNYLGLSKSSSSIEGPVKIPTLTNGNNGSLNLKATELRLGLPGSESPERGKEINQLGSETFNEKLVFPLILSKDGIYSSGSRTIASGNKRGFSDTINEFSSPLKTAQSAGNGKLSLKNGINIMLLNNSSETQPSDGLLKIPMEQQQLPMANGSSHNISDGSNNGSAPAAKAQVVGWPPVRSFRKNTLANNTSKNTDEVDGKQSQSQGQLFVKVSMDGAPYLRKVDLRLYSTYQQLSSALEKMFSCFTLGKSGAHEGPGSENKLRASLRGSEYVLTFEDKDGDWMLVGDVPWGMFIGSCKRLKIMKGSDAIGLAPRSIRKVQD